jgi:putative transposase
MEIAKNATSDSLTTASHAHLRLIPNVMPSARTLDSSGGMSRDIREEIAGGTFHVMNRGNRKVLIFEDDNDRRVFWRIVRRELEVHGVVLCSLCLMGNHFHMVITTPHGNRADFVGAVEGQYASYVNERYGYVGYLYQGRYVSITIEDDIQLLTALCYVFLNPVSAGLVTRIEDYRWCTYRASVGFDHTPRALSLEWLRTLFPGVPLRDAQRRFHDLMQEAKPVVAYFDRQDWDVEPDALKRVVRSYVGNNLQLGKLPRRYRSALRPSLAEVFPQGLSRSSLAPSIYQAHVEYGYRLVEVATHLRMHRVTISRIFREFMRSQSQ